ncbi:putative plus-end-directed kinesin ATPase [Medicago truncatula]|uniref:Kinesin motor domain protein n=1 Tax=Medicago truncatula TaxID=3880 RepID=A0A072VNB1_MEDTR|nr:kinesin-like protein KIN-7O isoform X2 [Medicago truncatula]KEH43131.1 kinesin motor domain protein [Medicago truncatula]RHN80899.1 putative plus-end-directed kinesin ATPase [Medicago truncatula]
MERIHVTVRARPLSPEDAKTTVWRISGNSIFIPNHSSKFEFDQVFNENCKTSEVYEAQTKDIVATAVRGFNGTVFAYGQTNSGKTHTMRGSKAEPGVIPRAVHDLFQILEQDVDREFLLRMSYMEIYNEEINDLLAPEHRKLQIHENIERGIYVAGLREEIVTSPEQVLDLMEFGESHRHIGETNMNLYSSRSHTIFRMIIESRDRNEDESTDSSCDAVRVSVLNLVDLAGSERAAKTGAEGVRLKEGSHINKSLMTLGTVIKKLSEGVESQGGHVPYRDSKLTRILQPALGGNANTAIICNITLAQIHTDETKSSLQFASRALRVTNCAKVNEIMTDAALLKRQKKEIEDLRAKLTGFRSEHLETEILNLRNTLLQTELERERIALELEEEKKTQAEWEKRVHEQAKRIENLSSMVLFSNRDENNKYIKKEKRRDTWCPGNLSQTHLKDVYSSIDTDASPAEPIRPKLEMGPLLPFNELINEDDNVDDSCKKDDNNGDANDNFNLPNPCALLHVTNRRKDPSWKKCLSMEDNKDLQLQAECENFRESEAILVIKKLQEQINILEMEKSSSQQNLDTVFDLATEQNISAREKFDELNEELRKAREAARVASEQLISSKTVGNVDDGNVDFITRVSMGIEDIMSEVQNSKEAVQSAILMVDDATKSFSTLRNIFLDFRTSISQDSVEQKLIFSNHQKLNSCLRQTISDLENEKILLDSQLANIQKLHQESELDAQSSHNSLLERLGQQELENGELISYIQTLEQDISCLTSSSVAKEKETLRRDLEKTKTRLKETEFKLKNAMQEKTKLEGEKACAEREIKRLHGQTSLLERDINKRDSLASRRRDSTVEKSSKMFDPQKPKGPAFSLEEYKKLEVFAFESETRITSLEEEITAALKEKEEMISINEALNSELEDLTEKLSTSTSEIYDLKEEISALKQRLEESDINQEKFKSSIKVLAEEKEELAMQLTDALLEIEEERAIWSAKEKDALLAIEEQARSNNEQHTSLSTELAEVRRELKSCREECKIFRERLTISYENMLGKEKSRENVLDFDHMETNNDTNRQSQEISKPKFELQSIEHKLNGCPENEDGIQREVQALNKGDNLSILRELDTMSEFFIEFQNLKSKLSIVAEERDKLTTRMEDQQKHLVEVEFLLKHCQDELSGAKNHIEELSHKISCIEVKIHADKVTNMNETAKLRMRLRGTQAKLDAFRCRYKGAIDESVSSKIKYREASEKLKDMLASQGLEVLNLKKQLAAKEQ